MRRAAVLLNAVATAFFAGFLAWTFFARHHLDRLAREFVTQKSVEYAEPLVDSAEAVLGTPLARQLLTAETEAAVRAEIAEFHENPFAYVADLTRHRPAGNPPDERSLLAAKIAEYKEQVRRFYDDTLSALIADLRIFAGTNLVAAALALILACRASEPIGRPVVWFSVLLFVGVLYCTWLYVDSFSFFTILFRSHMGWAYPVLLLAVVAGLWWEYGNLRGDASTASVKQPDPDPKRS